MERSPDELASALTARANGLLRPGQGVPAGMTDNSHAPDIIDDGASDVMAEDEVVHVAPGDAELAEAIQHRHDGSDFIADVPAWNEEDPLP